MDLYGKIWKFAFITMSLHMFDKSYTEMFLVQLSICRREIYTPKG